MNANNSLLMKHYKVLFLVALGLYMLLSLLHIVLISHRTTVNPLNLLALVVGTMLGLGRGEAAWIDRLKLLSLAVFTYAVKYTAVHLGLDKHASCGWLLLLIGLGVALVAISVNKKSLSFAFYGMVAGQWVYGSAQDLTYQFSDASFLLLCWVGLGAWYGVLESSRRKRRLDHSKNSWLDSAQSAE